MNWSIEWQRWVCAFRGHTRGKRQYQGIPVDGYILVTYACKRCGVEWRRKVKVTTGASP